MRVKAEAQIESEEASIEQVLLYNVSGELLLRQNFNQRNKYDGRRYYADIQNNRSLRV